MSYGFVIGNAIMDADDGWWAVTSEFHSDAPDLPGDDGTGQSNRRSMTLDGWDSFAKAAKLGDFDAAHLAGKCDGHIPVDDAVIARFDRAVRECEAARARRKTPQPPPGFDGGDATYARLLWFAWWLRYARAEYGSHAALVWNR